MAGSGLVVASCAPSIALASYPDLSRSLALNNVHTGENLETCYFDGKSYVSKEMVRIDKICRDFRRNEIHKMDKKLFDQISLIQSELGVEAEVQIISGYRSPATNKALRAHSSGVAKKSYHMTGQAIDFRLDGVNLRRVRDVAREIKAGGVGYYPNSNFVHIDTGPVRYWS
nr:YcbK family protein [Vibrio fluminensis]